MIIFYYGMQTLFLLKKNNKFDKGYPIFDIKREHHQQYFNALKLLLPNLRFSKFSYISEL